MTAKYIIIGDGVAGATAAKELREMNEEADIRIFTDESEPLYNRIMLKTFMKGSLPLQYTRVHDKNWYEKRDIDLHLETEIKEVDRKKKSVHTNDGLIFDYDKLLIATGGSPRNLSFENGYENVHYMWTMKDAERIKKAAEESEKAVVIGGGLLGIDLAVAFAENGAETEYLIRESNWWSRGLDKEGAKLIHSRLEDKGVNVRTNTEVEEFQVEDERVTDVITSEGEKIQSDAVGVAIGQEPNSEIVEVDKNKAEMIKTDKYLRTSDPDIYAAGNMVEYESPVFERRIVNGSWDHSEAMGKCAGKNMAGEDREFDYINTYGVGHFDVQFLAIGDWNGEPISRKYSDSEYRRLFFDGKRLVGAVMIGFTRGQEEIKKMISEKQKFDGRKELLQKNFWQ